MNRLLVVNADDFGLTEGINQGIVRAHEEGIVSSASLMVCPPAAEAAAAYARAHPELGLGLHLDLWDSVPLPGSTTGDWMRLYERCADEASAIEAEFRRQLARFRALVGRDPDHLDTHQHVHRKEPIASIARRLAKELGSPLRDESAVRYVGGFYGQYMVGQTWPEGVSVANLLALVDSLSEGATEFGCHPGFVAEGDPLGGTMYRGERNLEVATLTDPRVRARLSRGDVRLVTFPQAMAALDSARSGEGRA